MLIADNRRNRMKWTLFKENPPKENGWYYCTVSKDIGGYARELFYKNGRFIDNIRLNMFDLYDVYGKLTGKKIEEDCDWTDLVVAWMPLPDPYTGETE